MEQEKLRDDWDGDDYLGCGEDGFCYGGRYQNEPAPSDSLTEDHSTILASLAGELMRDLPKELHNYKPLVISAVRKVVPRQYMISGTSDAVRILDDAFRKWQSEKEKYNAQQFSAYAKKCVYGRLSNAYNRPPRSIPAADDPREQTRREQASQEERLEQTCFKMFFPVFAHRQDLLRRLQKHGSRKDMGRHLKQIRRSVFLLLPDIEQYVIFQHLGGDKGKDIAERLRVSPSRVTQLQQEGIEWALGYMADLLDGMPRVEIARQSAQREIDADLRSQLLSECERNVVVSNRTSQVHRTGFVRWNGRTRLLERVPRNAYWSLDGTEPRAFPDVFKLKRSKYRPVAEDHIRDNYWEEDYYEDWQTERWQAKEISDTYYSNPPK